MFIRILILILSGLSSTIISAEDETDYFYIKPSAFSGTTFMDMIDDDKALYLLGLGDGINLAPFFKANDEIYAIYHDCFLGLTGMDRVNLVTAYLNQHPVEMDQGVHITAFKAYSEYCYDKEQQRLAE